MPGKIVTVTVDRPMGSAHPKYPDMIYPVNYGYLSGTLSPDGEPEDAYILGVEEPVSSFTGCIIAQIHRENDIEDKWVVAPQGCCFTEEEIRAATHFQEQFFKTKIRLL